MPKWLKIGLIIFVAILIIAAIFSKNSRFLEGMNGAVELAK